jgi:hypothetical protein
VAVDSHSAFVPLLCTLNLIQAWEHYAQSVRICLYPALKLLLTHNLNPFGFSYPIAISIVGVPLSVVRWVEFRNAHIPTWAVLLGAFLFDLSGLINVLLFVYTRHGLFLPRETQSSNLPESALDSVHEVEEPIEG